MTLSIKDSPELNGPGKPGTPSQNSENNSGKSPRSNPVCLEVVLTIRSLPTEAGGVTQPIREEGRTVIVFDNGAVLRCKNNLPVGQTVILSNPSGRDVVCRVVGGRNLPSVKGYVEVEFIEPVNDFWRIHQDANPPAVATPPAAAPAPQAAPAPPSSVAPRVAAPLDLPAKLASVPSGSGPATDDVVGRMNMNSSVAPAESRTAAAKPGPEITSKDSSGYNHSEIARPTALATWDASDSEPAKEKHATPAAKEALSTISPTQASSNEFIRKGMMDYAESSSSSSNGRMPLIVGLVALALAGICATVFVRHRNNAPVSVAKTDVASQPLTPVPSAASGVSTAVPAPQEKSIQSEARTQIPAQPVAVDQTQSAAAIAAIPAVVTGPANSDSRTDSRNDRRQEKSAITGKQPAVSSSRHPAIPNLKMGSPSAPNHTPTDIGQAAVPITEIASNEAVGGSPPAALLTSAGRTSNPPAPPPSVPAPVAAAKTVSEPKLISSTGFAYPQTAKQANIQGSVAVAVTIDASGKVIRAKALSGPLLLRQAAEDSVKQWKFSPGLLDGKPAPSETTVRVEFRLN